MSEGRSAEELTLRVAELEVRVALLSNELEDVAALTTVESTSGVAVPPPLYDSVDDWVGEYFAPTFGRPIGGEIRWCAQWREHAEAIGRLEALWRSWEALRLNPALGMVTWLTSYLDLQLPVLLSRAGPFSQCTVDRHEPAPALPAPSMRHAEAGIDGRCR